MKEMFLNFSKFLENHKTLVFVIFAILFLNKLDSIDRTIYKALDGYGGLNSGVLGNNKYLEDIRIELSEIKDNMPSKY